MISTFLLHSTIYADMIYFKNINHKQLRINNLEGNFLFQDPDYKGEKVLLFFFGIECPYCLKELPDIITLSQYIHVIGVHGQFNISDAKLKKFAALKGVHFPILDAQTTQKLIQYLSSRHMWLGSVPYHIMIDKYGNLEPIELEEITN